MPFQWLATREQQKFMASRTFGACTKADDLETRIVLPTTDTLLSRPAPTVTVIEDMSMIRQLVLVLTLG